MCLVQTLQPEQGRPVPGCRPLPWAQLWEVRFCISSPRPHPRSSDLSLPVGQTTWLSASPPSQQQWNFSCG